MPKLGNDIILQALKRVGQRLSSPTSVRILIVGGAAAVLTKQLPAAWTTSDVDVMQFDPPREIDHILDVAGQVGRELSLPPLWLNSEVGLWRSSLADGWKSRQVRVGVFGALEVNAISRKDLVAMKFMAHRPEDLQHLRLMALSREEFDFVHEYLIVMTDRHEAGRIERAKLALKAFEELHGK